MKSIQFKLIVLVLACTIFTSCVKEDDGIYFNEINEVKATYSTIELEILGLVNSHRESLGLKTLEDLDVISSVALSHTSYMAEIDKVNHDHFSERQENLILKADAISVGENVAYGYNSSKGVVEAWLKSDSHRAIIENENYTHFGISTEKNSDGRNYFTQIFIKR